MKRPVAVGWLYAALGLALWMVPLLRVLHVESASVVAGVGFVASGLASIGAFRTGAAFGPVLRHHLALLAIPWALLTLTVLWTPNLGYAQGLLLYITFTVPSVALAVALAYAITGTRVRRPKLSFLGITLAVLVLPPLYDLGLHAQFYHYNHVFGGVLGPIYDEELAIRPGLFAFRGLTLLWATAAFLFGQARRTKPVRMRLAAVLLLIGLHYAAAGWMGFNTPAWRLRQALPGHVQTAHFDLYFDPAALSVEAARRVAREHEWRYAQLRDTLGFSVEGRIQSYLYPDPRTRARLTGAALTSVAPVWLPAPQMHLLQSRLGDVLAHELVHVFSRQFGLPVLRASRQVGLVEGLAVALEPPDGLPSPHEQVVSAALASGDTLLTGRLAGSLGAGGFWTGRGAVSYTTTGSFVRYLVDTYGAQKVQAVYAWGDFERVYGKPVEVLAEEWEAALYRLYLVALGAGPLARQRFGVPSLFEQKSPHYVPRHVRQTRRARQRLATADTLGALTLLEQALEAAPDYAEALDLWAALRLAQGEPSQVLDRVGPETQSVALTVRRADALAMLGDSVSARHAYTEAFEGLPAYAHGGVVALQLRAALAGQPGAVAALYGRGDGGESAVERLLRAIWSDGSSPERAYRVLVSEPLPGSVWPTPGSRNRAEAQVEGWRAAAALGAELFDESARHARQAAARFEALGDLNASAFYRDLAAQARWAASDPGVLR